MGRSLQLSRTSFEEIQAKLNDHSAVYQRIQLGHELSIIDFIAVPSLREISQRISRQFPKKTLRDETVDLKVRDQTILKAAITHMMGVVRESTSADEMAHAYELVINTLNRFGSNPAAYLKSLGESAEQESQGSLFRQGVCVMVKAHLTETFKRHALFPDDVAVLKNETVSDTKRLDALMRPLPDQFSYSLMTTLEEALAAEGQGCEIYDCLEEIIPDNVFTNVPAMPFNAEAERKYIPMRARVSGAIQQVMHADTSADCAAAYGSVIATLSEFRMTPEEYLSSHIFPQLRPIMQKAFQKGALAYVHDALVDLMISKKGYPGKEDNEIFLNPAEPPINRSNALFRNSGAAGVKLLTVLEEAGFDLEGQAMIDGLFALTQQKPLRLALPQPTI